MVFRTHQLLAVALAVTVAAPTAFSLPCVNQPISITPSTQYDAGDIYVNQRMTATFQVRDHDCSGVNQVHDTVLYYPAVSSNIEVLDVEVSSPGTDYETVVINYRPTDVGDFSVNVVYDDQGTYQDDNGDVLGLVHGRVFSCLWSPAGDSTLCLDLNSTSIPPSGSPAPTPDIGCNVPYVFVFLEIFDNDTKSYYNEAGTWIQEVDIFPGGEFVATLDSPSSPHFDIPNWGPGLDGMWSGQLYPGLAGDLIMAASVNDITTVGTWEKGSRSETMSDQFDAKVHGHPPFAEGGTPHRFITAAVNQSAGNLIEPIFSYQGVFDDRSHVDRDFDSLTFSTITYSMYLDTQDNTWKYDEGPVYWSSGDTYFSEDWVFDNTDPVTWQYGDPVNYAFWGFMQKPHLTDHTEPLLILHDQHTSYRGLRVQSHEQYAALERFVLRAYCETCDEAFTDDYIDVVHDAMFWSIDEQPCTRLDSTIGVPGLPYFSYDKLW